jgi:two-component system chemotaxis response regulator CheB
MDHLGYLKLFSKIAKRISFNKFSCFRWSEFRGRHVYIAPGDKHLRIAPGSLNLILDDGPKENFVRPAADPLFRSAADAFGKYCIAVILTGLGRDGAQGAAQISALNGTILIQDPETCVAPSMPNTIIEVNIPHKVVPLSNLSRIITETILPLSNELKEFNK